MARAYEELDSFGWNAEELRTYEQSQKYEWAYNASMEQKFDEGMAKGEKMGIQKIVKRLIEQVYSIQEIENMTGISHEEMSDEKVP